MPDSLLRYCINKGTPVGCWLEAPASHEGFLPFEQLALYQRHKACMRRWCVESVPSNYQMLGFNLGMIVVRFWPHPAAPHALLSCMHVFEWTSISCHKEFSKLYTWSCYKFQIPGFYEDGKTGHIWSKYMSNVSFVFFRIILHPNSARFNQVMKFPNIDTWNPGQSSSCFFSPIRSVG